MEPLEKVVNTYLQVFTVKIKNIKNVLLLISKDKFVLILQIKYKYNFKTKKCT